MPLRHLEQPAIVVMKQTRAFVFWTNIFRARTRPRDMRDQAARSESRILGLFSTRKWGEHTRGWGDCLLLHFRPRVLAISGQAPLSQLAETNCAVFPLQHHFSSKYVQQDEHDLNAACSTTNQVLNLCDKKLWCLQ